ncbi:MAG TPA: hypothetical protein VJ302_04180 [Blastocatellia bacterium]|nr:hypothetical protein [Blastocatellia bacterium]
MGPQVALALYRPFEGKDAELRELIAQHIPTLRRLELITDRPPILLKSKNGTYIEIFEWRAPESARAAHHHPEVAKVWEAMGKVCDFPALESLDEARAQFPNFDPIQL